MNSCSHSAVGDSFYNHYLQHHAQLTQWFQQLQQTIDPNRSAHFYNANRARPCHRGHSMQRLGGTLPRGNPHGRPAFRGPRHCCSAQARPSCCVPQPCCPYGQTPQQYSMAGPWNIPRNIMPSHGCMTRLPAGRRGGRILQSHGYPVVGPALRQAQAAQDYVAKQEEESDDSIKEEDNSSSEDELICDVDAFIALEKSDDSDKASEDSFELVDSVEDEKFKFEYVEMDEYGIMQRRYGKRREVNTLENELLKKQQREYLYGEKADAICGLETLMAINFDHYSDMNQPILWPVLPLAL